MSAISWAAAIFCDPSFSSSRYTFSFSATAALSLLIATVADLDELEPVLMGEGDRFFGGVADFIGNGADTGFIEMAARPNWGSARRSGCEKFTPGHRFDCNRKIWNG